MKKEGERGPRPSIFLFLQKSIQEMLPSRTSPALSAGPSSPRYFIPSGAARSSASELATVKTKAPAKLSPRSRIKPMATAAAATTSNDGTEANFGRAASSLDVHHSESDKLFAAAAERNKAPILEVLRERLPRSGIVLEVASGTGQHAAFFAKSLMRASPGLAFLPTEADASSLPSIRAHAAGMPNVLAPRVLDVERDAPGSWPREAAEEAVEEAATARTTSSSSPSPSPSSSSSTPYSAIYCANLTHISPFAATLGLFRGAGALLEPNSALFLYGPFAVGGKPATPSDAAFDASLRARDSRWGYRDIEAELVPAARASGLMLEEKVNMPANNFLCVFRKK